MTILRHGTWRVYSFDSPLDWGWDHFPDYSKVILHNAEEKVHDLEDTRKFVFDFGRLLSLLPYQDELRGAPHCIFLPDPPGHYLAGVIWKIDNSGTTYLAAPASIAAQLIALCGGMENTEYMITFMFPRMVRDPFFSATPSNPAPLLPEVLSTLAPRRP